MVEQTSVGTDRRAGLQVLGNYLIGLREGLEAALVVSILVAYLVRVGRRDKLVLVGAGVGAAIALSVAFGAALTYTSTTLLQTGDSQETFGGTASLVAVALVTAMIFWMRKTARHLKTDLDNRLDTALKVGGIAVALTAFVAVGREGLETALFFWSAVQAAGSTRQPGHRLRPRHRDGRDAGLAALPSLGQAQPGPVLHLDRGRH